MLRIIRLLSTWFAPGRDALFNTSIPWDWRPRLLGLQLFVLLAYPMSYLPYLFSRRYKSIEIPTRGRHTVRAIVFLPPKRNNQCLAPLHLDFHSGGFIGGIADTQADWCSLLSNRTGAVVVSTEYRLAPRHGYPCAHEDVEDVVDWVTMNAENFWNADRKTLTVSGFSAGANLMFMAGAKARAAVGFYAPVDLRLAPWDKPKSGNYPKKDPFAFLLPLYDTYAGPVRELAREDSSLNPILRSLDNIPENILFIVPLIDILVKEQLEFIEQLKSEQEDSGGHNERRFETVIFDKGFHGWLELPRGAIDEADRKKAFDKAIEFISYTHKRSTNAA